MSYYKTEQKKTEQTQQQQKVLLYEDDTVQLTKDQIKILKYYFPVPMAKTINMVDVEKVNLRDNTDGQVWGTTPDNMDKWFALDQDRHNKKQYLQILVRGSDVKAAFSPKDPKKVLGIIEANSTIDRVGEKAKEGYNKAKQEGEQWSESIKEKFNETKEGLKNVKDKVVGSYEEGKENAKVSEDNKVDQAKQNAKQNWEQTKNKAGQKTKEAGQGLKEKGNEIQN